MASYAPPRRPSSRDHSYDGGMYSTSPQQPHYAPQQQGTYLPTPGQHRYSSDDSQPRYGSSPGSYGGQLHPYDTPSPFVQTPSGFTPAGQPPAQQQYFPTPDEQAHYLRQQQSSQQPHDTTTHQHYHQQQLVPSASRHHSSSAGQLHPRDASYSSRGDHDPYAYRQRTTSTASAASHRSRDSGRRGSVSSGGKRRSEDSSGGRRPGERATLGDSLLGMWDAITGRR